jgi:uncharacterized membrane protein
MKTIRWSVFIFFSVGIGLYPLLYLLLDMSGGLLASKGDLLQSKLWNIAFYQHILLGAVAMLTGWSQFSKRIRNRNLNLHRALGKIYVITVGLSGAAGFYLALFATGGLVSSLGFSFLAVSWLVTTFQAYLLIRKREVDAHQYWMIRSYALCWAAVTLRLWIPFFQLATDLDFISAYRIIAWLCWVPNLIVAEFIIANLKRNLRMPSTKETFAAVVK